MHLVFAEGWRLVSCASHRVDSTLARWRLLIFWIMHKVLLQALYLSNGSALLDSKIILIILRVHVKLWLWSLSYTRTCIDASIIIILQRWCRFGSVVCIYIELAIYRGVLSLFYRLCDLRCRLITVIKWRRLIVFWTWRGHRRLSLLVHQIIRCWSLRCCCRITFLQLIRRLRWQHNSSWTNVHPLLAQIITFLWTVSTIITHF